MLINFLVVMLYKCNLFRVFFFPCSRDFDLSETQVKLNQISTSVRWDYQFVMQMHVKLFT